MIDLYHHGSSVCAAKVRFALGEKNLTWQGHYLDILKGDQFAPDYLKLNPKAVVPTLVHDGNVIVKSTVINEYLDDVFPEVALKPNDPQARAAMRVWTKAVDEDLHPACAEVTFSSCHRHIIKRLSPKDYENFLASTPSQSVMPRWHERKKEIVTWVSMHPVSATNTGSMTLISARWRRCWHNGRGWRATNFPSPTSP